MEDTKRPREVEHGEVEDGLPDAKRHCPDSVNDFEPEKASDGERPSGQSEVENKIPHSPSVQPPIAEPWFVDQATTTEASESHFTWEIHSDQETRNDHEMHEDRETYNNQEVHSNQEVRNDQQEVRNDHEEVRNYREFRNGQEVLIDGGIHNNQDIHSDQETHNDPPAFVKGPHESKLTMAQQTSPMELYEVPESPYAAEQPIESSIGSQGSLESNSFGQPTLVKEDEAPASQFGIGNPHESGIMYQESPGSELALGQQSSVNKDEASDYRPNGEYRNEAAVTTQDSQQSQFAAAQNFFAGDGEIPESWYTKEYPAADPADLQEPRSKSTIAQLPSVKEEEAPKFPSHAEHREGAPDVTQNIARKPTIKEVDAQNSELGVELSGEESNTAEQSRVVGPSFVKPGIKEISGAQQEGEDQVQTPAVPLQPEARSGYIEQPDSSENVGALSGVQGQNVLARPLEKEMLEHAKKYSQDLKLNGTAKDIPMPRLAGEAKEQSKKEAITSQELARVFGVTKPGAGNLNLRKFEPNLDDAKASFRKSPERNQKQAFVDLTDAEKPKGSVSEPIDLEAPEFERPTRKHDTPTPVLKQLPLPCKHNGFPRWVERDASVYIILSNTDSNYQYKLHSKKLADSSKLFQETLQKEVPEVSPKLIRQQLSALKKPIRYELVPGVKSGWRLVRQPFTALVPNTNKNELEFNNKSQEAPPHILRAYHNMLSLICSAPLSFNLENTLSDCVYLVRLATLYGPKCETLAVDTIRGAFSQPGVNIFPDAKNDPPLLLEFAEIIQNGPLYKEAMIHLVGISPTWKPEWKIRPQRLNSASRALLNSKREILNQRIARVNIALFESGIGIDEVPVEMDPADKTMYDAFVIQSMWTQFFRINIRKIPTPEIGDFYRLLSKGGDHYLSTQHVEGLLDHFRGRDFGYWDEVEEDLGVMKKYAVEVVQELVINNSLLDVEKEKITWLTCTEISDEELPWVAARIRVDTTQQSSPSHIPKPHNFGN